MANGSVLASLMFLLAILLISSSDYGYVVRVSADVTDLYTMPAEKVAGAMYQPAEHAAERATNEMEDKAADLAESASTQAVESSLAAGAMSARKLGEGMKADMQNANANGLAPGSLKSAFNNAKNLAAGISTGKFLGGTIPSMDNRFGAAPNAAAPDAEAPNAAAPYAEAPNAEAPDAEAPDAAAPNAEAPDAAAGPAVSISSYDP